MVNMRLNWNPVMTLLDLGSTITLFQSFILPKTLQP